jgi:predicted enzyme related to lactoylglutathione lyase
MAKYTPGTPCWLDLGSPDVAASREFYGSLFGWTSEPGAEEYGGYTTFYLDGKSVGAVGGLQSPQQPSIWTSYFATDDVAATHAKVERAGGKTMVAPMEVTPFGTMAIFFDPGGAAFGVWQPAEMPGADALFDGNGTAVWFELATRDVESAKSFYPAILGLTAREADMPEGQYTLLELGETSYAGVMGMSPESFPPEIPSHWMIYFAVPDTDAAVAKAQELGGKVLAGPMDMPPGRFAVLQDQFGATFSVINPNPDFRM